MGAPVIFLDGKYGQLKITWFDCDTEDRIREHMPITQVYGVCFDELGQILVIDQKNNGVWQIPGGTVETDEDIKDTLARELLEEADVELAEIYPVGVQLAEDPNNPNINRRRHYQARFAGIVSKLHKQTPDPDTGRIYPRKFVPREQINEVVNWGETGRAMFAAANRVYEKISGKTNSDII